MRSKTPALLAFGILSLGLGIWIVYLLYQPPKIPMDPSQTLKDQNHEMKSGEWFYAMSEKKQRSFEYPTSEMVLQYNFDRGVEPLRVFVNDLSEYRFYCINQILLENKIEYAYYKTNSVIQLVIFLSDVKTQKKILEDFDYYKIKYSLQS